MKRFGTIPMLLLLVATMFLVASQVSACELQVGDWKLSFGTDVGCKWPLIAGPALDQTIAGFGVNQYTAAIDTFEVYMYVLPTGSTESFSDYDFAQLATKVLSEEVSAQKEPTIQNFNGRDWAMASGKALDIPAWAACTLLDDRTLLDFIVWDRQTLEDNILAFEAERTKKSQQSESGGFGRDQYDPEFDPNYKPNGQTDQGKVQQSGGLGQALEDL